MYTLNKTIRTNQLQHKLIKTNHFGFRSKNSTEHVLITLIDTIKK